MITLAVAAWMALSPVDASSVYRCVGSHGETVFSGQPCNTPAEPALRAEEPTTPIIDDHCASSANELLERVLLVFDGGDVNALGGLFLWRGFGTRSAYARMRELRQLLLRPLVRVDLGGPPDWIADTAGYGRLPGDGASWIIIETAGDDIGAPTQVQRFALSERDGCVWLEF